MSVAQSLAKLRAHRKNPDVYKELSNSELADLVFTVLSSVEVIDKAIREGRVDGYTPKADKDYVSRETALSFLTDGLKGIEAKADQILSTRSQAVQAQVQAALATLRNGDDGIVSDAEIARAAELAYDLISLPDFDALVLEKLTSNPEATRDGLELLQDDNKLSQAAISGLPEDLAAIRRVVSEQIGGSSGTIGKQQVYGFIRQAVTDGTIPAGGGLTVETPSGIIDQYGAQKTFTVTAIPKWILTETGTCIEGFGYSRIGLTITMEIGPTQFIRAYS